MSAKHSTRVCWKPLILLPNKTEKHVCMYVCISHKTTRVVKTCPPCMFEELEDRKSYENHVIYLGKNAL